MKARLLLSALIVAGLSAAASAQVADAGGKQTSVPTNSPEPITLVALAGGAAVAGGAAYRKRKQSRS